jgi:hypothetical protein
LETDGIAGYKMRVWEQKKGGKKAEGIHVFCCDAENISLKDDFKLSSRLWFLPSTMLCGGA